MKDNEIRVGCRRSAYDETIFSECANGNFRIKLDCGDKRVSNYHDLAHARIMRDWLDAWIKEQEGGGA